MTATRSGRPHPAAWLLVVAASLGFMAWELRYGHGASLRVQSCANGTTIALPSVACLVTAWRCRADRRIASAWLGIGLA